MNKDLDKIEQFLKDNRLDFDNAQPNENVWDRIFISLSEKETDTLEGFISKNKDDFDIEVPAFALWDNIEKQLHPAPSVETFIKDNREAFDAETPHLKVWSNIEKRLNALKGGARIIPLNGLRQAAAAIALLIVGAGLGIFFTTKTEDKALAQVTQQVAPDLKEAENFYNQKVETKLTQLVNHNPDPSVMADLKQIDEIQEELKKELKNAPASTREEIVRRLIENYQIKLGILERVLNHIEENQIENQKLQHKDEKI